ncbi:MAG: FAD-binding protein, partial [Muribaculaceae bacterium]|nr:FAD-binding protein [Muribaculaceae bacterium]
MLDSAILQQLREIFRNLDAHYTFRLIADSSRPEAEEMRAFLADVASTSDRLACELNQTFQDNSLEFSLLKEGVETGVTFRGIPNGHEFTSLLLAVLNADGKGKNLPDEALTRRIQALRGDICLTTYVSLTCTNCPDVVQALNIMALLNPSIRHEMVDGALFQSEAAKVQAVPSVYAGEKLLHVGRGSLGELLEKLEAEFESTPATDPAPIHRDFDVLVLGGGPAGASAAIYSARKGLKVGVVAGRIGGQVKETVGIENLISVPRTTGAQLADDLRTHLTEYPIELFEQRTIEQAELQEKQKTI